MDNEGNLIIPDDAAIARACPVTLPAEAGPQIEAWRKTLPQAQAQAGAGSTGTDSEDAKKAGTLRLHHSTTCRQAQSWITWKPCKTQEKKL